MTTDRCDLWHPLWEAFSQAHEEVMPAASRAAEPEVRRELLFVLLGGHGVTFEVNLSALQVIEPLDVFGRDWDEASLSATLEATLSSPCLEPRRLDGSLRRYRFPRRKAQIITQARAWVMEQGCLTDRLGQAHDEQCRREWLLECPGLGPKSASWLLRNVGWAADLAILDVHVLRAMAASGRIELPGAQFDYAIVEAHFVAWCDELDVPPGVFDLFLWEWQRGTLTMPRPLTAS